MFQFFAVYCGGRQGKERQGLSVSLRGFCAAAAPHATTIHMKWGSYGTNSGHVTQQNFSRISAGYHSTVPVLESRTPA